MRWLLNNFGLRPSSSGSLSTLRAAGAWVMCCSLVLWSASPVYAGGFETKGLGSRALGMGGAAIGLADDWSTVYWNPAGLASLEGSGLFSEVQMLWSEQRTSQSVRNLAAPPPDYLAGDFVKFQPTRDVEPDRFSNTSLGAFIPTPDLGWFMNFGDYTVATGLYATSGGGVAWEDRMTGFNQASPNDSIDARIELAFFTLNVPLAVAMKFHDRLSVGLNLSGVIGYNDRKVTKIHEYADGGTAPLQFENSSSSLSFGVGLDLGVKAKITRQLHVGGVLRLPYTMKGSGQSRFEIPEEACEGSDCSWRQYVEEDENRVETDQPLRWGIGLAYLPTERLKLALDYYRVSHSQFVTRSFYDSPEGSNRYLADSNPDWGFEDAYTLRFGAEYLLSREHALRTGFIYDPSPFKSERASLTSPRFTDAYVWTAGYGGQWGSWRFDCAYQFVYSPERMATVSTMSPAGVSTPEKIAVTAQAHVATLTVGFVY